MWPHYHHYHQYHYYNHHREKGNGMAFKTFHIYSFCLFSFTSPINKPLKHLLGLSCPWKHFILFKRDVYSSCYSSYIIPSLYLPIKTTIYPPSHHSNSFWETFSHAHTGSQALFFLSHICIRKYIFQKLDCFILIPSVFLIGLWRC